MVENVIRIGCLCIDGERGDRAHNNYVKRISLLRHRRRVQVRVDSQRESVCPDVRRQRNVGGVYRYGA